MSGGRAAPASGRELEDAIAAIAQRLGLEAHRQLRVGRRVWGAERRIDVVLREPRSGRRLGIECKFQGVEGSAEEKIPATIRDIGAWPIDGLVVIGGDGFSDNMRAYLLSTGKVVFLEDLEIWIRLYFNLEL